MGNQQPQPRVREGVCHAEAFEMEESLDSLVYNLVRDGFVVIPGAVKQPEVHAALRIINRSLGKHPPIRDRMCPDCGSPPEVLDLFHRSEVRKVLERILGRHQPVGGAQIALRFPGDNCTGNDGFSIPVGWEKHWHIDGLAAESNPHTPYGDIHNFSALVGVLLQDCTEEYMGNLTVYPGSHLALQNYFEQNGFASLLSSGAAGLPSADIPSPTSALDIPTKNTNTSSRQCSTVKFPCPPKQICGRAGDMILVNYCTAHTIAPNRSPFIRYAVYFRITSASHSSSNRLDNKKHRPEAMLDVWRDWSGLRLMLEQQSRICETMIPSAAMVTNNEESEEEERLQEALERSKWDT